jgi:DNA polymerase-3 subunit alpha
MVLFAKNFRGYKNLAKLSSLDLPTDYAGVPRISKKQIVEFKEDLIAVTSGIYGDVPNAILNFGEQKGEELFLWWKEQFGDDFYVQIQNHDLPDEEHLNEVLLDLADKHDVKILAQNETFIPKKKILKFKILSLVSKTEKEFLRQLVKVLGREKVCK